MISNATTKFYAIVLVCLVMLTASTCHATIVVGSKTSPGKGKADFVCDDTDDQEEIERATNSLPPTSGKVELLAGTYHLTDSVEITTNHVTICEAGSATILKHVPA